MPSGPQNGSSLIWVVAVAMVNERGETLVQLRPKNSEHGDLWEFPGGKIDAGELPQIAAVREMFEELGVKISVQDLHPVSFASQFPSSGTNSSSSVAILLYYTQYWSGTPTPMAATRLAWCKPADLADWPMPPLDYPLAVALDRLLLVRPD